ncbi:hypothetical protein [Microbacterium sp. BH-3-3-3]|uniref:hypothetical protein n=1 Tax=Microbacterium sp. BH-3-3-3 TaxID=1906742 RepID=UPI0021B2D5FC|nr:hypothetical protein [Microbacterium sp. BH-3-3-3]
MPSRDTARIVSQGHRVQRENGLEVSVLDLTNVAVMAGALNRLEEHLVIDARRRHVRGP